MSSYLPLLLMALLALGTWWLVKLAPKADVPEAEAALRHEPDYRMTDFSVQRFGADGALRAQIEGATLRHYPDTDTLEIDQATVHSYGAEGRITVATARQALAKGDASEVTLTGGAKVVRDAIGPNPPLEFLGESLQLLRGSQVLRSEQPVTFVRGGMRITADAMDYQHADRVIDLTGRVRATFPVVPR
jgi:lipopolysaccharide export system protein LptC